MKRLTSVETDNVQDIINFVCNAVDNKMNNTMSANNAAIIEAKGRIIAALIEAMK